MNTHTIDDEVALEDMLALWVYHEIDSLTLIIHLLQRLDRCEEIIKAHNLAPDMPLVDLDRLRISLERHKQIMPPDS